MKYVHRSNILSITLIGDASAHVLEMVVPPDARHTNIPLQQLHFPKGGIIGTIVRDDQVIILKRGRHCVTRRQIDRFCTAGNNERSRELFWVREKMIRIKTILNALGKIILIVDVSLLLPLFWALFTNGPDIMPFLYSILIATTVGGLLTFAIDFEGHIRAGKFLDRDQCLDHRILDRFNALCLFR